MQARVDAPGELLEADLDVIVDATNTRVELRYRLRPAAGAERIPLRALDLPDARPLAVTATAWEDPVPVSLAPGPGGLLEGDVLLPTPTRAGDVVILRLRYRVGAARSGPAATPPSTSGGPSVPAAPGRVRVPVLTVPWPPAEALPGTFEVGVALPEGTLLGDGFPATWVREGAPAAGASRWRATLPVLPALVGFRVLDRARPTLPGVLTVCALILLGALLTGGVLHLRRT